MLEYRMASTLTGQPGGEDRDYILGMFVQQLDHNLIPKHLQRVLESGMTVTEPSLLLKGVPLPTSEALPVDL